MHTAHFAAALAIRAREPRVPLTALVASAFAADLVWMILVWLRVENASSPGYFDDWSHSLATSLVWACAAGAVFWRKGPRVMAAVFAAGALHFPLDLLHPAPMALYPYAALHLGWSFWRIGLFPYWLIETAIVVVLIVPFVVFGRRRGVPRRSLAASLGVLAGLHAVRLISFYWP
jgi:hypothetical protein